MTRARRRGLGAALALPLCLALASPAPARPAGGERAALDDFDLGRRAGDQLRLPARLREVSDLSLAPGGRLFAVADERAELFAVDAARGTIAGTVTLGTPAVRGDFEGLAAVDGVFYLITSQGMMYEAPDLRRVATLPFRRYDTGVGAACEIEGLGYEPADRILLIACKHPYDRALLDKVTLFRWSLERRALASPARLSVPLAAVLRGTDARAFSRPRWRGSRAPATTCWSPARSSCWPRSRRRAWCCPRAR